MMCGSLGLVERRPKTTSRADVGQVWSADVSRAPQPVCFSSTIDEAEMRLPLTNVSEHKIISAKCSCLSVIILQFPHHCLLCLSLNLHFLVAHRKQCSLAEVSSHGSHCTPASKLCVCPLDVLLSSFSPPLYVHTAPGFCTRWGLSAS